MEEDDGVQFDFSGPWDCLCGATGYDWELHVFENQTGLHSVCPYCGMYVVKED